jgi:hypothetical protein
MRKYIKMRGRAIALLSTLTWDIFRNNPQHSNYALCCSNSLLSAVYALEHRHSDHVISVDTLSHGSLDGGICLCDSGIGNGDDDDDDDYDDDDNDDYNDNCNYDGDNNDHNDDCDYDGIVCDGDKDDDGNDDCDNDGLCSPTKQIPSMQHHNTHIYNALIINTIL